MSRLLRGRCSFAIGAALLVSSSCSLSQLTSGGPRPASGGNAGLGGSGGDVANSNGAGAGPGFGAGGSVGGATNTAGVGGFGESGAGGMAGEGGELPLPDPPHVAPRWACTGTSVYYVSTSGDDAQPGSSAKPFASVQHAVSIMSPGDKLVIHAGTYSIPAALSLDWQATADAPTCIVAAPGETVILDGGSTPDSVHGTDASDNLITIHGSYVLLDSLTLRGARCHAILTAGGRHVELINSELQGAWRSGVWEDATSDDVRIAGSRFTDNCQLNSDRMHIGQCHTIFFGTPNEVLIDSVVARNYGAGIVSRNSSAVHVARTFFMDNSNWHIKLELPGDALLEKNQLYTTGDPRFLSDILDSVPYAATSIAIDASAPGPTTGGVFIKNNLLVGGRSGLDLASAQPTTIAVANNTFYGSSAALVSATAFQTTGDSSFFNNIFVQVGAAALLDLPVVQLSNNGFYRVPPGASLGTMLGTAAITSAPAFVASEPKRGQDFALLPTSPYVGAGMVLNGVQDDLFGQPRGTRNDLGALQQ